MIAKVYTINDIKQLLNKVLKTTEVEKAILFGSYAKNTPTKTSDIDILIDSNGKIKGLKFFALMDIQKKQFISDKKTINACVFNLSQIGELAGKISDETIKLNSRNRVEMIKGT